MSPCPLLRAEQPPQKKAPLPLLPSSGILPKDIAQGHCPGTLLRDIAQGCCSGILLRGITQGYFSVTLHRDIGQDVAQGYFSGIVPGILLRMWFRDLVPQWDRGAALEPRVIPGCDVKAASMPECSARPTAMHWQNHTDASAIQRQVAALGDTVTHPLLPLTLSDPTREDGHTGSRVLCPARLHGRDTGTLSQPLCPPWSPMPPGTSKASPWLSPSSSTGTLGGMTPRRPGDSSTFPGASPPSEYMATLREMSAPS